jgi:uncharacterized membrane protein
MQIHSGPLPSPETLARYNDIIPDAANRILHMAEEPQQHRMGLEKHVVLSDSMRANLGLLAGFIVAMTGLIVSGLLGTYGHEAAAVAIGGIDLVGLVSVFIYGYKGRRQEREEKARPQPQ